MSVKISDKFLPEAGPDTTGMVRIGTNFELDSEGKLCLSKEASNTASAISLICVSDKEPITESFKVERHSNDMIVVNSYPLEGYVETTGNKDSVVEENTIIYLDSGLVEGISKQGGYDSFVSGKTYSKRNIIKENNKYYILNCAWLSQDVFTPVEVIDVEWQPNTFYTRGTKLYHINNTKTYHYEVKKDFTSTSEFNQYEYVDTIEWRPNISYDKGTMISYSDKLYVAAVDHKAGSQFEEKQNILDWSTDTSYIEDDLCKVGNKYYKCITPHNSGLKFLEKEDIADWDTDVGYSVNDLVKIWKSPTSYICYKCKTAHTSNEFDSDVSNWTVYMPIVYWSYHHPITYWNKYDRQLVLQGYKPAVYWEEFIDDWKYTGDKVEKELIEGNKYYNYLDNKIYTFCKNSWSNPELPKEDVLYIDINRDFLYRYNGDSLVRLEFNSLLS